MELAHAIVFRLDTLSVVMSHTAWCKCRRFVDRGPEERENNVCVQNSLARGAESRTTSKLLIMAGSYKFSAKYAVDF